MLHTRLAFTPLLVLHCKSCDGNRARVRLVSELPWARPHAGRLMISYSVAQSLPSVSRIQYSVTSKCLRIGAGLAG